MKVLVVEDTRTLQSLLRVYLVGWGLEFHDAHDGLDALGQAARLRPDLILSDVKMPGMDGFALCAAIRADPVLHATPLVLLTSLKDEASRQKGLLLGASAFLTKPVQVEALRATVRDLLHLAPQGGT